jgi:hypothetical protein
VRAAAALLDPAPPRDGIALAETVRALADGRFGALLDAHHSPLAPLLAAIPAAAGLAPEAALALVAVLCGAAALLPLHSLARRLFDVDAANGAALLYAVTPPMVRIGSTALAEPPLLLLALLSVDAAARALRHWKPARDAALAGLAGGAAFLARPEGAALLPLALAATLPAGGGRPWRHRLAGAAAALLAFAAVAGPWLLYAGLERGRFDAIPGKRAAVLLGAEAPMDPKGAAVEVHSLPAACLQALGSLPEAMHPVLAVLAILGIARAAGMRRCGKALGPVAFGLVAALLFLGGVALLEWRYGYGGRRHASTAGLLLVPFAGAGLLTAGELLGRAGGPFRRPVVALGVLMFGVGVPLLAGALLQRDASGGEARALGLRIRDLAGAGARPRVGTFGEPRVAWFARGEDVRLLREFGIPPGAPASEGPRRADALRWFLKGRSSLDFLVLKKGDDRVPPAVLKEWEARPPDAEAGALRAWRVPRAQ